MAGNVGRKLLVKKNGTNLMGVQNKSIATTASAIDITSDDDLGYRTFLAEAGELAIDLSVDGIAKDTVLRDIILNGGTTGQLLTDITIEYPNGDTIAGDFFFNSYTETGTYNEAVTFSATLQSSGAWTFTDAP